jgi:hypothetical protein
MHIGLLSSGLPATEEGTDFSVSSTSMECNRHDYKSFWALPYPESFKSLVWLHHILHPHQAILSVQSKSVPAGKGFPLPTNKNIHYGNDYPSKYRAIKEGSRTQLFTPEPYTVAFYSWWTFCKMQIISTPSTIWFELILRKGPDSPVLIPSANASQKYGPPEPKTQSEPPNAQTSEIGQEQELFC